jgi:hypothetical protein
MAGFRETRGPTISAIGDFTVQRGPDPKTGEFPRRFPEPVSRWIQKITGGAVHCRLQERSASQVGKHRQGDCKKPNPCGGRYEPYRFAPAGLRQEHIRPDA